MRRTAACLLVLPALVALATAAEASDPCPQAVAYVDLDRQVWSFPLMLAGRHRQIPVYERDFADLPEWEPSSGSEPPVSLGEAIGMATSEFQRTFADFDQWRFDSVSLQKWREDTWVYMAQWSPVDRSEMGGIFVPVLMSGRVIPLDRTEKK
ncbi:MAG: hypothetical protein ACREAA_00585 [Candidatus Polarisedimenticolia bacterium]